MLWDKGTAPEDWVTRFTVGDDYKWDRLLLPYDVAATRAHVWGLAHIDILTDAEHADVDEALDALLVDAQNGDVTVRPEDEDCHTVIEQYLTERLGDIGKKIHTGRSRNDQVLAALRLFLRAQLDVAARRALSVATVLCDLGEEYDDAVMPGHTHMQPAMPTTAGLWALGYAELLAADLDGLAAARRQINVSPLGSAAGYGVPYLDLPRQAVAERLAFRDVQTHVTAVQLSRGKLELQAAHALVQTAASLNRLASDLVLFNTAEYGFVKLPAEYCTGSSIMPQKQNPDVLELARATYHRLAAEMQVLVSLPANLPSGYHRDLQLTKEAVMRVVLGTLDLLAAVQHVLPAVRFRRDRMRDACTPGLFATADALERVARGVPFRDAYRAAADEVDALEVPDAPLAAYVVDGYPGRGRPDLVREKLSRYGEQLREAASETVH